LQSERELNTLKAIEHHYSPTKPFIAQASKDLEELEALLDANMKAK
jgi:hypothetical protein